ncbi:hypothetical protein [Shigella phage ESh20]|nr:hypothetical protein [Shigella phage ESh20]
MCRFRLQRDFSFSICADAVGLQRENSFSVCAGR